MIFVPRGCCTIRARTAASATVGVPITVSSPPSASTSLNSTCAPTSPSIRSTAIWSPTPTLYCFPPVLTITNMLWSERSLLSERGRDVNLARRLQIISYAESANRPSQLKHVSHLPQKEVCVEKAWAEKVLGRQA